MASLEIEVSNWPVLSQEMGGAEPKDWIAAPEEATSESSEKWWLFKPVKFGIRKMSGGASVPYRRADDVAEWLACRLAALVDLPAANIEFARRGHDVGIISRNVTPDGWSIQGGDILLSEVPGYESCQADPRPRNRIGHNLENICRVLESATGPAGECQSWPAFTVFAGYLVFDAWIANTDRHALNWAVLQRDQILALAPSFDHGSALASGVDDDDLLHTNLSEFSRRGCASRFENGKSITLVEWARRAVDKSPEAQVWLDRLATVSESAIREVVTDIPGLSVVRRSFVEHLLIENRRRLLA